MFVPDGIGAMFGLEKLVYASTFDRFLYHEYLYNMIKVLDLCLQYQEIQETLLMFCLCSNVFDWKQFTNMLKMLSVVILM